MAEAEDQSNDNPLVSLKELLLLPADRYGKRLRAVLNEIDHLHGVPRIKPIGVKINEDRDDLGRYVKHSGTGKPLRIELSRRKNDQLELTFAHEIGHLLEAALIPGSSFGVRKWAFDDLMRDWRFAVRSSVSFRKLENIAETRQAATVGADGTVTHREADPRFLSYLLEDQELWARSYAQYVAVSGQNSTLLEQIRPRCFPRYAIPVQWSDNEFEPILQAVDELFNRLRWRR